MLTLEGSPRERGQCYGESLRREVQELVDACKEKLQQRWEMGPDEYITQYVRNSTHLEAVERWTPKLLEEVRGIAEGAAVDFEILFGINCIILDNGRLDRLLEHAIEERLGSSNYGANQCSGIGVYGEDAGATLLAQNCDNAVFFDGLQVILHIKYEDSDLESIVFTVAGGLFLNGMNNAPLAVVVNLLPQLNSSLDGLPFGFIGRTLLEQRSLENAINFARTIKHARGFNFMVADRQRVIDLECSANQVSEFVPYEKATRIYHTNHPLVNNDKKLLYRIFDNKELWPRIVEELPPEQRKRAKEAGPSDTHLRYDYLESQLRQCSAPVSVQRIKSILGAHVKLNGYDVPICKHKKVGSEGSTTGCSIMEVSNSPRLHFAPGPPCSTEFETYKF